MIVVVGAGPAGLAMAYYLQQFGLPYRVLEKHDIGHTWGNQYDRLHLHTLKTVSGLPGWPMPAAYPRFPSATEHHDYLQQYACHFGLNIDTGVEVQRADYRAGGWQLHTNRGVVQADILIAATGIWSTPHRPHFANEAMFRGAISHSRDYSNPQPYQAQRVLVVGAGNSGCEIAVDLSERGVDTTILIRGAVEFVPFPSSAALMRAAAWFFRTAPRPVGEWVLDRVRHEFLHLGLQPARGKRTTTYPVVGFELPQAISAGRVKLCRHGIDHFTPTGVVLANGQPADFEAVILATGFRPTLPFISPQDVELDTHGRPCVDANWRSTRNPHLFCVGYHYPATEGWLQAIGRVTYAVAQYLK